MWLSFKQNFVSNWLIATTVRLVILSQLYTSFGQRHVVTYGPNFILCYAMLCYSILFYSILFYSMLFYALNSSRFSEFRYDLHQLHTEFHREITRFDYKSFDAKVLLVILIYQHFLITNLGVYHTADVTDQLSATIIISPLQSCDNSKSQ